MSNTNLSYIVMQVLNEHGNAVEVQYNAQEEISFRLLDTSTEITFDFDELTSVFNTITALRFALGESQCQK